MRMFSLFSLGWNMLELRRPWGVSVCVCVCARRYFESFRSVVRDRIAEGLLRAEDSNEFRLGKDHTLPPLQG